ncbi:RDD family protein [Pseudanabaena sp. ABRG5-3]|uniref:RDD family protein n=1 Tax=Pseudanabaena sp. ABRG5-3 TaxID=685565 RepID=UPI000DC73BE9|nr:RDD family protein [Pseudanabaena sp. ABRG5-3]BBC24476.1 RDD family protein [Pseudanabaena sp. ABRG5-3]
MNFFNKITLQTPESVELEFTLAGIGNRAQALMVDYILLGGAIAVVIFTESMLFAQFTPRLQKWYLAIALLITFGIFVGYFIFFESLWQGQTPGKRYAKIRVIRDDGRPAGLSQATLRALLRPIDDVLSIGFLMIVFNKQEKRLGDLLAGTVVIQEERPSSDQKLIFSDQSESFAAQLLEVSNLSLLLPDDFASIREFLQRRQQIQSEARQNLSRQLARQLKSILELETIPFKSDAETFIESVFLAYQQQTQRRRSHG